MADTETLQIYDAKAGEYATLVGDDAGPDTQLQAFLDRVPAGAKLWDLGCGPGRTAQLMAQAGHDVLATDGSAEMVARASARPGVTARRERFDEMSGEAVFDGVFANFSLLHATAEDLPVHVAAISKALKPGGIFHIGMKTGTGTSRDSIGRRYTYVTEEGLETMLISVGLEPLERWFGDSPGLSGENAPWIVMQARKNG